MSEAFESYPTALEQFAARLQQLRGDMSLRDLDARTVEIALSRGAAGDKHDRAGRGVSKSVIARLLSGDAVPSERAAALLDEALEADGKLEILAEHARTPPYVHLPLGPPAFVGRRQELAALQRSAQDTPPGPDAPAVLVLSGPPGVGKTALALQWANHAQNLFDVALYANLKGYSGGERASTLMIVSELLYGLGVEPDRMPTTLPEREALLRDHVRRRGQRMLVVLDNARDARQVEPVLPHLAGVTVLVTSRPQLSALVLDYGAAVMRVDTMDEAEAAELAAEIIGDERAEAEPEALAQLVDLCGSLPLAMIIAAERVAADPDTSLQQHVNLLADVGRRPQLLDVEAEADESLGVFAAFRKSFEDLEPAAARMFRLLSVHPGTYFCRGMASAIAGVSREQGEALLEELLDAHLLERQSHRYYRFHDLLRVYAAKEAAAGCTPQELARARARLVRCFLHTANAASWTITPARDHHVVLPPPPPDVEPGTFSSFEEAYRWCTRELPNMVPMVRLALQEGLLFEAWRTVIDFFDYFTHARSAEMWISGFQVAIDAARAAGDVEQLAEAQEKLAEGYRRQGLLPQAYQLDLQAAQACAHRGPSRTLGFALLGLGNNAQLGGDYTEAMVLTQRAVDTFHSAGTWIGEATGRISLSSVHRALGHHDLAIAHGELAVTMFQTRRDDHGTAVALLALARTHHQFGELARALARAGQAVPAFAASVDSWGQADALALQGRVAAAFGDHATAAARLQAALELSEGRDERTTTRLRAELAEVSAPGRVPP